MAEVPELSPRPGGPRPAGTVAASFLLIAVTVAVFLPSLKGEFVWGDDLYITRNMLIQDRGLGDMWLSLWRSAEGEPKLPQYYPLTFSTFWIEWRQWGDNPLPYHVANIILHALGAVLLWRLLRRLDVPGAWFAAAIFAIHPIQVDSVTWISERVNTLSGVFFLSSFLLYWRHEERGGNAAYALSLFMFVLALLSKTATVVLPAMLVLVRWWKQRPWRPADVARLIPFFVLSACFAWITIGYEKGEVGAKFDATLLERCLLAGRIAWFYFIKLVWPRELVWVYPLWDIHAKGFTAWLPLLGLLLLLFILAITWWRSRAVIAAVGCFLVGLFPVMGFFDIYYFRYSVVADHFNYLPGIAIIALAVGAAAWALRRVMAEGSEVAGAICGAVVVAGLGVLTWRHQPDYFSTESLYRSTLAKNPAASMPRTNLGVMMAQRARNPAELELAMKEYETVLQHNPKWDDAHTNWGDSLAALGRLDEAADHFRKAIELNPNSHQAHNNLGTIYADQKKPEEAIVEYQKALELNHRYPEAHNNLATSLAVLGKTDDAITHFKKAVELRPSYVKAHFRLARQLVRQNRADEAVEHLRQALGISPDFVDAHIELGTILATQGKLEEAEKHLTAWVRLRPNDERAKDSLAAIRSARGTTQPSTTAPDTSGPVESSSAAETDEVYTQGSVLVSQNRPQEAIPFLEEVLRLDPNHSGAHNNLGIALANVGRREEGMDHLAEAVRLQPDFAEAHSNLGTALLSAGQIDAAVTHCAEAVRLKPNYAEARHYLAVGLAAQGRQAEAAAQYREALRLLAGWPASAIALAWILATSPDDKLRNGMEAVYLAEEICRSPQNQVPSALDALAAAYAEAGRFEEAITTAEKAMQLAHDAGQAELVKEIEARWKLYQAKKPFRAP